MAFFTATLYSINHSIVDYHACAKMARVPPPPTHAGLKIMHDKDTIDRKGVQQLQVHNIFHQIICCINLNKLTANVYTITCHISM
jgi:hypothetical protein